MAFCPCHECACHPDFDVLGGSNSPAEKKNWTITILDRYEEIATVKVNCPEYVEYVHLARQDGQWQIVNILYTHCRENL